MMADVLLVVHFLIAAFIVGGLLLVWIGAALGWRWVRNPWFRYLHLGAIAFVAAEALLGVMCPLTVWEDMLRGGIRADSFVGRWVRHFLYYQAPEWVFTAVYLAWTAATLLTLRWVAPRRTGRKAIQPFCISAPSPSAQGRATVSLAFSSPGILSQPPFSMNVERSQELMACNSLSRFWSLGPLTNWATQIATRVLSTAASVSCCVLLWVVQPPQ